MGCMSSKPVDTADKDAVQRSARIEKVLKNDKKVMDRTIKILLLGAGESGKSTIIKQMRIIHSGGFPEDERRQTRAVIYSNLVIAFKVLLDIMRAENIDFQLEKTKPLAEYVDKLEPDVGSDEAFSDLKVRDALRDMWDDTGVQKAVARGHEFALHDNLHYFFDSLDRIFTPGWLPDNQDMLQARLRTTVITETLFELGQMNFRMMDVGGQRSERKKWIHCFEGVQCLLFMVALSGYDQCLVEDQNANQMHEAMMLFESLVNGEWFKRKPIILFLNKIDLFKGKLHVSPVSNHFPDYNGSNTDFDAAARYFADRFRGINRIPDREIYIHYTNATDTTLLKATMDSVTYIIAEFRMIGSNFDFASSFPTTSSPSFWALRRRKMLSSSLRRAAWAPMGPIAGISRATSQSITTSANGLIGSSQHVRQRRYSSSSSKPSDGSNKVDSSSQTPAKGVNSAEKREGKASRRRGKDSNGRNGSKQPTAFSRLPSVPSTQHLQPHDVHVASFFSIHRPISVSTTVPPTSTPEAFDAIFTAKKPAKPEVDDVIFTLSSAVNSMENSAAHSGEQEGSLQYFDMEGNQLDGMNLSDLKVSVEELTKRLRPFHPPPPPVPFDEAKDMASSEFEDVPRETSSYSTVLTIHESIHSDGRKTYEAHTGPFVPSGEMEAPGAIGESEAIIDVPHNSGTTYMERIRNNRTMHAISTKRRRRLKMKKHKLKKLRKRTRTLRRKLEKA
ncbi:hypothetical protein CBS12448_930 [Aspergillus niger]|nr:hypothetical protein CBS12448_930 [Aspergillus niger]